MRFKYRIRAWKR